MKLSLACCAMAVTKAAVAQEVAALNVAGWVAAHSHASSRPSTVYFRSDGYDKIPPGTSSVVIDGYSCWGWEWCKGGMCAPSFQGAIEFEIAAQAIVVNVDGNLPENPAGIVTFVIDVSKPTVVAWPGGSVMIDPESPYDRYVDIPVAATPAGFPILFSTPFTLRSIETYIQVQTPATFDRWCQHSDGAGCEFVWYPHYCYGYAPQFIGGSVSARCEIDSDDGFLCICGGYADISARALAFAEASLAGNRFDFAMSIDWACPPLVEYISCRGEWRLGIDRPTRLTWDFASCGGGDNVFGDQCGGPGTIDLDPQQMPYAYGGYYQFKIVYGGFSMSYAESGSEAFRIENLRFERIYPADVVPNGIVDGQDISAILSKWGGPYDPQRTAADVNLDGQVSAEDLAAVLFAWGTPG